MPTPFAHSHDPIRIVHVWPGVARHAGFGRPAEMIVERKQDTVVVLAAVAAFAAMGLTWLALPILQSSEQAVHRDTGREVERARRLLHQYNAGLSFKSMLLDRLVDIGTDVDVPDPQALIDEVEDYYQQDHEVRWGTYPPREWDFDPPTPARASYGNLVGQVREGVRSRDALFSDNQRLLDEALAAVDSALAVTRGQHAGRTDAEANRLKGIIYFHKGLRESLRARLKREETVPQRTRLAELAAGLAQFEAGKSLVADSGIDERIAELQSARQAVKSKLHSDQDELARLDRSINDLAHRHQEALDRAESARRALESLQADGLDFSLSNPAAEFEKRLLALDAEYRRAVRDVQALSIGDYDQARLSGGDYLAGNYVAADTGAEPNITAGLQHYHRERAVLAAVVARTEEALRDADADLARLEGMKSRFHADEQAAAQRIAEIRKAADEAYAELNRLESEASVIEDNALELFDQSSRASKAAAGYARDWVSSSRERTSHLAPEAQERSAFQPRTQDGWMAGHVAAQTADALLEMAWIHLARYTASAQTARLLEDAGQRLALAEADPVVEKEKAEAARTEGATLITEAMNALEPAHRDAGRHWTFVAQQAGANYLLSLFDYPSARKDALAAMRNALKGRENEPYVQTLAAQLRRLERP